MAITFDQGTPYVSSNLTGSATVDLPDDIIAGDLVIVHAAINQSRTIDVISGFSDPPGMTGTLSQAANMGSRVQYRVADGSWPAGATTVSVPVSGSGGRAAIQAIRVRGQDATTPFDSNGARTASTGTGNAACPALGTAATVAGVVALRFVSWSTSTATIPTTPASATLLAFSDQSTSAASYAEGLTGYTTTPYSSGATIGSLTWATSGFQAWVNGTLAIRPATSTAYTATLSTTISATTSVTSTLAANAGMSSTGTVSTSCANAMACAASLATSVAATTSMTAQVAMAVLLDTVITATTGLAVVARRVTVSARGTLARWADVVHTRGRFNDSTSAAFTKGSASTRSEIEE